MEWVTNTPIRALREGVSLEPQISREGQNVRRTKTPTRRIEGYIWGKGKKDS